MKIFLSLFVFVSFAFSHKLNVFLNQEENKVYLSSYFKASSPCKNCEITVKDEKGNILEKAKTNLKGEYIITKLSNKIEVYVEAKGGHGAKEYLEIKNLKKNDTSFIKEIETLKLENQKLKSQIKQLEDELSKNELIKMIFALFVIAGIFFILKRVRKDA